MLQKFMIVLSLSAVFLSRGAHAGNEPDSQRSLAVDSIGITVSDLDRSVEFYTRVLGFVMLEETELSGDDWEHFYGVFGTRVRIARLRLGEEFIELMQFLAPQGRPLPADSMSNDLWFQHIAIIVSDIDRAYARLREHQVSHASSGPQLLPDWNPNAGGIAAFYFRDPDGNHLEILEFPPGKGQSRWQSDAALFLGIDHTAIVVSDTESGLGYYRDALGLEIVGESENYGAEQERLNNVFGARLRITALSVGSGIGVELLEYLAPRTGRAMPIDTRASDLWHWQINFVTPDVTAIDSAARANRFTYVSPGVVALEAANASGLMLRDPDGHAASFMEVSR